MSFDDSHMIGLYMKLILSASKRKVATLLEELSIPYHWRTMEFNEVKEESYLKITPNGRLPAIQDPNTGVTLWEVCSEKPNTVFLC